MKEIRFKVFEFKVFDSSVYCNLPDDGISIRIMIYIFDRFKNGDDWKDIIECAIYNYHVEYNHQSKIPTHMIMNGNFIGFLDYFQSSDLFKQINRNRSIDSILD